MKLDQAIADAVKLDGLPRQAPDETDTIHVLYLEAERVRSMLGSEWPPPLPTEPTPQESAAAIAARAAAVESDRLSAIALRNRVLSVANTAVGIQLDALTPAQVRALMACLLWKAGGLTAAGAVKPLDQWL